MAKTINTINLYSAAHVLYNAPETGGTPFFALEGGGILNVHREIKLIHVLHVLHVCYTFTLTH